MTILRSCLTGVLALALVQQPGYTASVEAFRQQRNAEIGGPTGWVALVGLHWLTPGAHTIGRASTNDIVLNAPSAPDRIGTLTVGTASATLQLAPGVSAAIKGEAVTTADLRPGPDEGVVIGGGPARVTMVVIKRGDRLGLRVWDPSGPARAAFRGLQWSPIDPAWRKDATFVSHNPAPKLKIQNVLGETIEMTNPGSVSFTIGGREYHLEALLESADAKELFFMFKDETSGKTTYGAGRYLYTDLPKDGRVVVDFNRAMNPPCAFTDFATCPLPPAGNRLTVSVTAGELNDGHIH